MNASPVITYRRVSGRRWVRRFYVASVAVYACLALLFTAVAYAQPRESTIPLPSQTFLRPPAGSSDGVVEKYFDYLDLQSLGNLGQTQGINWVGLLEAFGFGAAFLLLLYFFVFSWYARRTEGDLYPVEVYNDYITERNGGVDPFNWAVIALVLVYGALYIAISLRFGQIY